MNGYAETQLTIVKQIQAEWRAQAAADRATRDTRHAGRQGIRVPELVAGLRRLGAAARANP